MERRKEREKFERPEQKFFENPDCHFGIEVAQRISRFSPQKKAMAKAKIMQLLFDIEFPTKLADCDKDYYDY